MRERTPESRRRTYRFETGDLAVVALHVELRELELDAISDLEVIVRVLPRAALVFRDEAMPHGPRRGLALRAHVSMLDPGP